MPLYAIDIRQEGLLTAVLPQHPAGARHPWMLLLTFLPALQVVLRGTTDQSLPAVTEREVGRRCWPPTV